MDSTRNPSEIRGLSASPRTRTRPLQTFADDHSRDNSKRKLSTNNARAPEASATPKGSADIVNLEQARKTNNDAIAAAMQATPQAKREASRIARAMPAADRELPCYNAALVLLRKGEPPREKAVRREAGAILEATRTVCAAKGRADREAIEAGGLA